MPMWCMRPSSKEREMINRGRSNDGKNVEVENTSPCDDDWDVAIGLAGSGVVHGIARPYCSTGGSS